jgi:hypothetical protein
VSEQAVRRFDAELALSWPKGAQESRERRGFSLANSLCALCASAPLRQKKLSAEVCKVCFFKIMPFEEVCGARFFKIMLLSALCGTCFFKIMLLSALCGARFFKKMPPSEVCGAHFFQ